jgi:hypothetical protein
MTARTTPNDLYTRMVAFAFDADCPGATKHDRLKYLQDLMAKHSLTLADASPDRSSTENVINLF